MFYSYIYLPFLFYYAAREDKINAGNGSVVNHFQLPIPILAIFEIGTVEVTQVCYTTYLLMVFSMGTLDVMLDRFITNQTKQHGWLSNLVAKRRSSGQFAPKRDHQ
ncbi:hypothetical protein HanIR_Chr01g0022741 [Helianthus annuus]|nr:hypothetical protein HanIR_Chr01g0022741 [Helianthus annuus]